VPYRDLTCGHGCSRTPRPRFSTAVARRTKTASSSRTPSSARWCFRSKGAGATVLDDAPVLADAPAAPSVQAAAAPADSPADTPRESRPHVSGGASGAGAKGSSGTALLLGDAAGAVLLANEARYRTLEWIGIRREDANMATAIGLLMAANAVYERAHRPKPPKPDTAIADLAIGVGALRETIYGVAGPASRDTPLGGTLIALAVLGGLARPPMKSGVLQLKVSSRRMVQTFRGRYGHLVDELERGD